MDLIGIGKIYNTMKIIISLVLYAFGIALGFILLYPFVRGFQISIIYGIFSLALSIASLIYGILLMNKKKENKSRMITSRLTPLYKFYIPIFIIEILLFNTILLIFNIYPENDDSVFIVVEVILVLWVLFLLPCIKLYQMYLINDKIIVDSYFKEKVFNKNETKNVRRFFIFFFKIELKKNSFIILPKISESMNLFVIPKSVRALKNLI